MSEDDLIRRGDAVIAARSLFRLQTSGLYGAANVTDYGLLTDTAERAIRALPATAARADALSVLSGLSSYLGAGLGDDDTTAEQFDKRIRWAIDDLTARTRQAALREAVQQERERCAKIADAFAEENIRMAGDTVLHDPVLHTPKGKKLTAADWRKSEEMVVSGAVHSAMFHAAQNIAAAIRGNDPIIGEPST